MVSHANLIANATAFLGPARAEPQRRGRGRQLAAALPRHGPDRLHSGAADRRHPGGHPAHGHLRARPAHLARDDLQAPRHDHLRAQLCLRAWRSSGSRPRTSRASTCRACAWLAAAPSRSTPTPCATSRGPSSRPAFARTALLPCYGMAESTLAITFHQLGTPMLVDCIDAAALQRGEAIPSQRRRRNRAGQLRSCRFPGTSSPSWTKHGVQLPERGRGRDRRPRPERLGRLLRRTPEASRDSFPGDGCLRTGDLGYLADGNLYICGRKKDLIIIRGANYHPQDIEWAVGELPGVRRGNVVAFSVPVAGEERLVLAVECASGDCGPGVRESHGTCERGSRSQPA